MAAKKHVRKAHASVRLEKYKKNTPQPMDPVKKKKITVICAAVAAVAVLAAILLGTGLVRLDGSLQLNGEKKAIVTGDQWVIVNKGTSSKPRAFTCAQVTAPEGFVHEADFTIKNPPDVDFSFIPAADTDTSISRVYVAGTATEASAVAQKARDSMESLYAGGLSDVQQTTILGKTCYYFVSKFINEEALAEALASDAKTGESTYTSAINQQMALYTPAANGTTLLMLITVDAKSADDFVDESVMMDMAQTMLAGVTIP